MASHKFSSPGRHSLPRKKTSADYGLGIGTLSSTSHIQRGSFARNGLTSLPNQRADGYCSGQDESVHFEYFVPRSVSDFNLAATSVQDIAAPIPAPPVSVLKPSSTVAATPWQTKTITNPPSGNSCQGRTVNDGTGTLGTRSREKMVTFEDESCPGSTPTRKNLIPTMENVFM